MFWTIPQTHELGLIFVFCIETVLQRTNKSKCFYVQLEISTFASSTLPICLEHGHNMLHTYPEYASNEIQN